MRTLDDLDVEGKRVLLRVDFNVPLENGPAPSAKRLVTDDARMRVSSVIVPFLIGTLKSTRMKTRLPARSMSLTLRVTRSPS